MLRKAPLANHTHHKDRPKAGKRADLGPHHYRRNAIIGLGVGERHLSFLKKDKNINKIKIFDFNKSKKHLRSLSVFEATENKRNLTNNIINYYVFNTSDHQISVTFPNRNVLKSNLKTDAENCALQISEN